MLITAYRRNMFFEWTFCCIYHTFNALIVVFICYVIYFVIWRLNVFVLQASFDMLKSRNKRQQLQNSRKNGYNSMNGYANGFGDYSALIPTTSSPSYYPFYGNGTPFATQYGSSPPQAYNKYPNASPPQTRSLGNTPFRGNGGKTNGYTTNGTIGAKGNNFSRGLQSAFNGTSFNSSPYLQNDRYHWVKPIYSLKA